MVVLKELAEKYGTDKLEHGYISFYEKFLPKNPMRILEIGCFKGASARMWRDYFPLETEIHVLDLFEENPIPDIDGVVFHKGSQIDDAIFHNLRNYNFDVIIDDGSHNSRDQMISFFGLFNGKQYYIEDTHCCTEPFYQQGLPYSFTADVLFNILYAHYPIEVGKNIILIQC